MIEEICDLCNILYFSFCFEFLNALMISLTHLLVHNYYMQLIKLLSMPKSYNFYMNFA